MIELTKTSNLPNCQVPNSFFCIAVNFTFKNWGFVKSKKTTLLSYSCQLEITWLNSQKKSVKGNVSRGSNTTYTYLLAYVWRHTIITCKTNNWFFSKKCMYLPVFSRQGNDATRWRWLQWRTWSFWHQQQFIWFLFVIAVITQKSEWFRVRSQHRKILQKSIRRWFASRYWRGWNHGQF